MSYVTPVMAVVTALLSLIFDPWDELRRNNYFNNPEHISRSCLLMLFGGTLAFFMVGIHVRLFLVTFPFLSNHSIINYSYSCCFSRPKLGNWTRVVELFCF